MDRESLIGLFARLGERLKDFGKDAQSRTVLEQGVDQNSWFGVKDIERAVSAISQEMLPKKRLQEWLSNYPRISQPKNIGVIMAGNIPLVGFFDLMCVVISGHNCFIKPSSKDSVLIGYLVELLKEIEPNVPIYPYQNQEVDAMIATGSDNTNRYFKSLYSDIPMLLRGNRSSVAILTGKETPEQLEGLAMDIFTYSGLGCRSVSKLFFPKGYDVRLLAERLSQYDPINPKYINNFLQRRALLAMQDEEFIEGTHFLLRQHTELPSFLSEIAYSFYDSTSILEQWLELNSDQLQCVVHDATVSEIEFSRSAKFGRSQYPSLMDYPDDIDVIEFLLSVN